MSDGDTNIILGKLLANQASMKAELDDIKTLLSKHEETFTLLRGHKSGVIWMGSAVIATAAAAGVTITKLLATVLPLPPPPH
jgi:hypothetical protein